MNECSKKHKRFLNLYKPIFNELKTLTRRWGWGRKKQLLDFEGMGRSKTVRILIFLIRSQKKLISNFLRTTI